MSSFEERRAFKRFPVSIPFRFIEAQKNKEGVGEITDISASGAGMIVTCEKLEPLEELLMWLDIPGSTEPLHTSGQVSWIKKVAPGIFRIGIRFNKVDFAVISQALRIGANGA